MSLYNIAVHCQPFVNYSTDRNGRISVSAAVYKGVPHWKWYRHLDSEFVRVYTPFEFLSVSFRSKFILCFIFSWKSHRELKIEGLNLYGALVVNSKKALPYARPRHLNHCGPCKCLRINCKVKYSISKSECFMYLWSRPLWTDSNRF